MFYQILLSPQVKRSAIISNKLGIYELPIKWPNDLRFLIIENLERSTKSQKFLELQPSAQSSSQNKSFVDTSKKLLKNRNQNFSVFPYFTWKLEFVQNKQHPKTPNSLIPPKERFQPLTFFYCLILEFIQKYLWPFQFFCL